MKKHIVIDSPYKCIYRGGMFGSFCKYGQCINKCNCKPDTFDENCPLEDYP